MTYQVLCVWIAIQNTYNKKQNTTMAEIIENKMSHDHEIPSMGKANAGLTLG